MKNPEDYTLKEIIEMMKVRYGEECTLQINIGDDEVWLGTSQSKDKRMGNCFRDIPHLIRILQH